MIIYAADNIQHTVPLICEQYKPTRNDLFRKPRDTGRKPGALAKSENQGTSCYQGFLSISFFKLGFTPCKDKQPLRSMGFQENEAQQD